MINPSVLIYGLFPDPGTCLKVCIIEFVSFVKEIVPPVVVPIGPFVLCNCNSTSAHFVVEPDGKKISISKTSNIPVGYDELIRTPSIIYF